MAHKTFKARYYARRGTTEAQEIREGIILSQKRQQEKQEIAELAAAGGWEEHDPGFWWLHQNDELKAEVFKKHNRFSFTAVVWHSDDTVECGSIALEVEAMRWCNERIEHARRLNARVDELRASGAVDAGEGDDDFDHKQYLEEMADAKDDYILSPPF